METKGKVGKQLKKTYATPQLTVHGTVEKITEKGNGSPDGVFKSN